MKIFFRQKNSNERTEFAIRLKDSKIGFISGSFRLSDLKGTLENLFDEYEYTTKDEKLYEVTGPFNLVYKLDIIGMTLKLFHKDGSTEKELEIIELKESK